MVGAGWLAKAAVADEVGVVDTTAVDDGKSVLMNDWADTVVGVNTVVGMDTDVVIMTVTEDVVTMICPTETC